jgi:serine/threonine protein phosphatase PrpC
MRPERVGAATDVGLVREANEDALLVLPESGVVAVADGLGGHAAGEVASGLAVEALRGSLAEAQAVPEDEVPAVLTDAVQAAHRAVVDDAARDRSRRGMGTTLVVAHVRPGRLWVAHVGDSRAYLLHRDGLAPLTRDHGAGGMLTQALGLGDVAADVVEVEPASGDRLLLCTDGLTGITEEDEIARLLAEGPPQEACDALVQAALRGGGHDNVTVVVVVVVVEVEVD